MLEKCVEVTKEILEKEKWTDEDIKNHPIYEIFNKYGVTTIYIRFFKGNSYKLINSIYLNKFKPWELPRVPKNYWNTDTGIEAVRWMIEDELNWNNEEIKKQLCYNTFEKYRLAGMLNIPGTPMSAGFGISGLIGPINALNLMEGGYSVANIAIVAAVFVVIPVILSIVFNYIFTKKVKLVTEEDYKVDFK